MQNDDERIEGDSANSDSGTGSEPLDEKSDQFDQHRRRLFWAMPSGLYLLGSMAERVRNLMTINWVTQVASEPKLLGVSVENEALTHRLIEGAGVFTLSVVARDYRTVVRKFVKPAVDDRDAFTLNGIAYLDAKTTGLPVLADALGYFECQVTATTHLARSSTSHSAHRFVQARLLRSFPCATRE